MTRMPLSSILDDDHRAAVLAAMAKIRKAVLEDGIAVQVQDFGTFRPRSRPERLVRNPATGEKVLAKASVSVAFTPAMASKVAK